MVDDSSRGTTALRPRDFIDIITTPWLFNSTTIAIFCSTVLLPTVATEYGRLNDPNIYVAIAIGLLSVGVNGGIFLLVRGWVTRSLSHRPWAIVAILMAAGAIRGTVTSLIVESTNLETHSYLTTRIGLGAVSSPIMLAVLAVVISRVATSREQRRSTTRAIREAEEVRDRVLRGVSDSNRLFVSNVDVSLRPAVNRIIDDVSQGRLNRETLSTALDDLAENVVRPLSHSLARSEELQVVARGSIVREVFRPPRPSLREHINPYFSALGIGLGGFSVMLDGLSGSAAVIASLVAGVSTLAILLAVRAAFGDFRTTTIRSILIVAGLHEVVWLPAQFLNDLLIFPDSVRVDYALLGVIATPLLGLAYQLIVVGSHSSRNHLARLDTARVTMVLQQSEARRRGWLRQRHVAHTLHSSIQSRVHAQARLLRAGTGQLTRGERSDTVTSLQSVLTVITDEPPTRVDAIRSINELAEFWSGMCEITLEVDDEARAALDSDVDAAEAVSVVTLESVSNAIRHGNATAIDIDITRDSPETVRISVVNDGAALDPKHTPGLGMAIYEELTAWWGFRGTDHVAIDAVIAARGNNAPA